MPIPFDCECGKKLQAKDEFAGKKMRCPGCGKVLTIPTPDAAPPWPTPAPEPVPVLEEGNGEGLEVGPPASSPVPIAAAVVQFVCYCGRRLKGHRADAGEEIDCPDCGRTLAIPTADTDSPPPEPAPKRAAVGDGFLTQTVAPWPDAQARRRGADGKAPREEKVGSSLGTLVLLLLLAGGLGAWWYFMPEITDYAHAHAPSPAAAVLAPAPLEFDELQRIPRDTVALLAVRPGAPGFPAQALKPLLGEQSLLGKAWRLKDRVGSAERMTLVVLPADPRFNPQASEQGGGTDAYVVIHMEGRHDHDAIKAALSAEGEIYFRRWKGRTYYVVVPKTPVPKVIPKMGQPFSLPPLRVWTRDLACYVVNPKVFVVGDLVSIKHFLNDRRRPPQVGPLQEALARGDEGKPLLIGLDQTGHVLATRKAPVLDPKVLPLLPDLKRFTTATVLAGADDSHPDKGGAQNTLRLTFGSAKEARAALDAVQAWKAGQQQQYQAARKEIAENRAERALRVQGALRTTTAALGSVSPGQISPLAVLYLNPEHFKDLEPPIDEEAILERLKSEEAFAKCLAPPVMDGKTLRITLSAPPGFATAAYQLWLPYADLAVNAMPQFRPPPIQAGKGPGGKGKGGKGKGGKGKGGKGPR